MKRLLLALSLMIMAIISFSCGDKKKDGTVSADKEQEFWAKVGRAHNLALPDMLNVPHNWKSPKGINISSHQAGWTAEKQAQYGLEADEAIQKLFDTAPAEYTNEMFTDYNLLLLDPKGSSTENGNCATFLNTVGQELAGQMVGVNFISTPFLVVADPVAEPDTPECKQNRQNAIIYEGEHLYLYHNDKERFGFFQGAEDWHSIMERIRANPSLGRVPAPASLKREAIPLEKTHIRR